MNKYILFLLFFSLLLIKEAPAITPVNQTDTTSLSDEEQTAADALDEEDSDSALYSNEHYLQEPLKKDSFSRSDWNKAKKGLDYTERQQKKEKITSVNLPSAGSFFTGTAFKFIFAGAVITLLVILLWKIFAQKTGDQSSGNEQMLVSVEDIEDITKVSRSELEKLLKKALEKEDYKEAVRIYYVSILLGLSEKNMIVWKKEKTNREYLNELHSSAHYMVFEELTALFERIWYADIELIKPDYARISPRFKSFLDTIKSGTRLEQ